MEESKPIESNISFADATLIAVNFDEYDQVLNVLIEAWNEKKVKFIFTSTLFFQYQPGDFIADVYQNVSQSSIVDNALLKEFDKIPHNHNYKLITFKDINDFSVLQIVCEQFSFSVNEQ